MGLPQSRARTFFLRLLFQIKILPNWILRNCKASFSLHADHLGRARAGYSAEDVAEGGDPCPGPWASSRQPSRAESSPVDTASLQAGPQGLSALLLPPMLLKVRLRSSPLSGTFLNGKAQGPFPSLVAQEKHKLSRRKLWPGWKSGVGISQDEINIEEIERDEDCS